MGVISWFGMGSGDLMIEFIDLASQGHPHRFLSRHGEAKQHRPRLGKRGRVDVIAEMAGMVEM